MVLSSVIFCNSSIIVTVLTSLHLTGLTISQRLIVATDTSKAGSALPLRLRGGAETLQITVKPRLQRDLWSLYWKVGVFLLAQVATCDGSSTHLH